MIVGAILSAKSGRKLLCASIWQLFNAMPKQGFRLSCRLSSTDLVGFFVESERDFSIRLIESAILIVALATGKDGVSGNLIGKESH